LTLAPAVLSLNKAGKSAGGCIKPNGMLLEGDDTPAVQHSMDFSAANVSIQYDLLPDNRRSAVSGGGKAPSYGP